MRLRKNERIVDPVNQALQLLAIEKLGQEQHEKDSSEVILDGGGSLLGCGITWTRTCRKRLEKGTELLGDSWILERDAILG